MLRANAVISAPKASGHPSTGSGSLRRSEGTIMKKPFGALFFFLIMIVAGIGIANFLSITFYEKSLLIVIKDFIFILTKK
jgi:hypothetical protein